MAAHHIIFGYFGALLEPCPSSLLEAEVTDLATCDSVRVEVGRQSTAASGTSTRVKGVGLRELELHHAAYAFASKRIRALMARQ